MQFLLTAFCDLVTSPLAFREIKWNALIVRMVKIRAGSGFFALLKEATVKLNDIAHVAQLVEHVLGKDEVTGSNPVMGSMPRGGKYFKT